MSEMRVVYGYELLVNLIAHGKQNPSIRTHSNSYVSRQCMDGDLVPFFAASAANR